MKYSSFEQTVTTCRNLALSFMIRDEPFCYEYHYGISLHKQSAKIHSCQTFWPCRIVFFQGHTCMHLIVWSYVLVG